MDFKNYVRMMLEAENAKDKNEKAKDQDEDSDDEDDENEDEDFEATVKTGCNGGEASTDTDDDEDDDSDDNDDEGDECPDCGKKPCECKKRSLKEAMIYSSRYIGGEKTEIMTEETRVLVEGINDNSASKYLSKLAKRAEKDAARYAKKEKKSEADTAKKAAKSLKEASAKLYKCETRYKSGDVSAKKEYKQICKQYSNELKKLGKGARGLKGLIFTLLAGTVLLGGIGITAASNEDIIEKLEYGFQNKEKMPDILKDIGKNNKLAFDDILKDVKGIKGEGEGFDKVKDVANKVKGAIEDASDKVKNRNALDKDGYMGNQSERWAGKKADWDAQKDGWDNAADREGNLGYKAGKAVGKAVKGTKEFFKEVGKEMGKTSKGISQGFKAGK